MKKILYFLLVGLAFNTFAYTPFSEAPAAAQTYVATGQQPVTTTPAAQPIVENSGDNIALSPTQNNAARIQILESHDRDIISAIRAMNQNIIVLQQQLQTVNKENIQAAALIPNGHGFNSYINIGVAILLLLAMGIIVERFVRREKPIIIQNAPAPASTDNEYDFMGSEEAMPAQLDLARSYIAMNQFDQAKEALKVVLEKGNDEQRKIAAKLAHDIKQHIL